MDAILIKACKEMAEAEANENYEDAEIVGSRSQYWLGSRRISSRTVEKGLLNVLFSSSGLGTKYERHILNERGRECAETGEVPILIIVGGCED